MSFRTTQAGPPPWDMAARELLLRAKADKLIGAGATRVREELNGEDLSHIVMLDPEVKNTSAKTLVSLKL